MTSSSISGLSSLISTSLRYALSRLFLHLPTVNNNNNNNKDNVYSAVIVARPLQDARVHSVHLMNAE